jgi:predicted nucleic acid-binding protein
LIAKKPIRVASFIDSNILVYAEANDEPAKQSAALALLRQLKLTDSGVISTQVLQEYANVALRKMQLDANHVRKQMGAHQQFEVIQGTPAIIHGALDLHQTRSLSFYDALIVQAATIAGCDTLYSEDLNTGEIINGVRIVNPFV